MVVDGDTVIRLLHFGGFAGCLAASALKNRLLLDGVIEGKRLQRLLMLDRISGFSAFVILLSGLNLAVWAAQPMAIYKASPLFWLKVSLFAAASIAVVMTKPRIRRAATAGQLEATPFIQALLLFDLGAILVVAATGRLLAHGAVL